MAYTLIDLLIVFLIALVASFFWQGVRIKELARQATKRYCKERDVALLDDSVSQDGWSIARNSRGRLTLVRNYMFEFTVTGERRYRGQLKAFGKEIQQLHLETHQIY